jgi:predicted GIY-YIG superfamily endonuclease
MASPQSGRGHPVESKKNLMRQPAIYIMANYRNGTLYVGVTSDLIKRAYEHRQGMVEGFTKKYDCKQLVYYEQHATIDLLHNQHHRHCEPM